MLGALHTRWKKLKVSDKIRKHLIAIQVFRNGIRMWRMLKMNYENGLKITIKSLLLILRPIDFLFAEGQMGIAGRAFEGCRNRDRH